MSGPTADEIMAVFSSDIAILRQGRQSSRTGRRKAADVSRWRLTEEQLERKRECSRRWRASHKREVLEYMRTYSRAYRAAHREEYNAYRREYYWRHPEYRTSVINRGRGREKRRLNRQKEEKS